MNASFEPLKNPVALGQFVLRHQTAREPWNNRERHEQRCEYGVHHCDRQRPNVAAREPRQKQQWQEREDQRRRRPEYGDSDLLRRFDCRFRTRHTAA